MQMYCASHVNHELHFNLIEENVGQLVVIIQWLAGTLPKYRECSDEAALSLAHGISHCPRGS